MMLLYVLIFAFPCLQVEAVGWRSRDIRLTQRFINKLPFVQGEEVSAEATLKPTFLPSKELKNVILIWQFPSLVQYKTYKILQPAINNASVTTSLNVLTIKFPSLKFNETIRVSFNVTVDPSRTLADNGFHYANIGSVVKYHWLGSCTQPQTTHVGNLNLPFFSPACSGFGSFTIKDSEIKASTVKSYHSANRSWTPMTSFNLLNIKRIMKVNFIQLELKSAQDISMAVIRGVSKYDLIPKDIVKLSFGENHWKWKMRSGLQNLKTLEDDNSNDVTIVMTLVKPIKSRYMRINLPPYGNTAQTPAEFEVEVFSCRSYSASNEGSKPLGVESSTLVPDSQLTAASSASPQNAPSMARLNMVGGGWCASNCTSSEYLQVALGDEWKIVQVETQSQHWTSGQVNAVKKYSMSYSQTGLVWTPYKVNGGTKLFWGNDIANIATRHILQIPITAKFVRFEPRTCINNPCMRVELHGTKVKDLPKKEVPIPMERSILLKQSTNTVYVCATEVVKGNPKCFYSDDKGVSWKGLPRKVLSVIACDPSTGLLYGLSRNGNKYMRSRDSSGEKWRGIAYKDWVAIQNKDLIRAEHIPFVPISHSAMPVVDPIVELTSVNGDKWLVDQTGVYLKPSGGSTDMVLSFLPYNIDLSSDICHTGVCVHGKCTSVSGMDFKCDCNQGYVGMHCDTATDECASSPCQNGASCVDEHLKYKCLCSPGFYGDQCQSIDGCASNPCKSGGTCQRNGNAYMCACPPKYLGTNCEVYDYCSSSPCVNNATCSNQPSSFSCSCLTGYSGSNCEVTPCTVNPCTNGGTCNLSPGTSTGYSCSCAPNYSGATCTVFDHCSSSPCVNHGTCTNQAALVPPYRCTCPSGYSGTSCEVTPCTVNPCTNGGTCNLSPGTSTGYSCSCAPNYSGATCTVVDYCASSPCLNHGTCTNQALTYSCSCPNGYSGTRCQVTPCSSPRCLNGGTCNLVPSLSTGYNCTCTKEYVGKTCGYGKKIYNRGCPLPTTQTWAYNGKYDKLVFHSNVNLDLYGICLSQTTKSYQQSVCTLTSRVRKESVTGSYLASISGTSYCGSNVEGQSRYLNCPRFSPPVRLNANERYILELTVSSNNGLLMKLINRVGGVGGPFSTSLPDGSHSMTYSYETVSSVELADSTGTTVAGGGIYGIVAQYAVD